MNWKSFATALILSALSASGATLYTPWTAFRGTNGVALTTNPSTATLVIGPATPISTTASNAATALNLWTNDGVNLFPKAQVSPTNGIRLHDNGRIAIGKIVDFWWGTPSSNDVFLAFNNLLSGEPSVMNFRMETLDDAFGTLTNATSIELSQNNQAKSASFTMHTEVSGGSVHEFHVTLAPGAPLIRFTVLGSDKFLVDGSGNETITGQYSGSALNVGTNVQPFNFITTNLLTGQTYTNLAQRGHVVATVAMTNVLAGDVSAMSLIVDQNGDGTWDTTNGPVRINGVALSAGEEQLFGLLQPGARFAYTNQSAGVSPGVSIRAGSCQWSRW